MAPAIVRCSYCGREGMLTDPDKGCRDCRRLVWKEPTEKDALTGGSWVRKGGVQVYVPGTTRAPEPIIHGVKQSAHSYIKPFICGTGRAYAKHLRDNEDPCDICKDAERQRGIERRAAKGMPVRQDMKPFQRITAECTPYRQKREVA